MNSAWILLPILLAIGSTESLPLWGHRQPTKERAHAESSISITIYNNNTNRYNMSVSLPHSAILRINSLTFVTAAGKTETFWNQRRSPEKKIPVLNIQSLDSEDGLPTTEDRQLSTRIHAKRFRRATSKFTGLVVGAYRDSKVMQTVAKTLAGVVSSVWSHQSQFSKPFSASKREPSVILGTFSSDFRTNFHGFKSEANLRRSSEYSLLDVNSLSTLLILQCLVEAAIYGSATTPAASNVSIGVESLKNFYTHAYSTGSSILTMWPEKLLADQKVWVSRPENIIGGQVKDNTTFQQLQSLAKSCNCEPVKSGFQKISEDRLCKDYFSRPLSELFTDIANPPDFLISFSNLALGSILQFSFPGTKSGVYKAESQLWMAANTNVQVLIDKLKSMAIVFPAKVPQALTNDSASKTDNSTASTGKTAARLTKREAISHNLPLDITGSEANRSLGTILDKTTSISEADTSPSATLDNSTNSEVGEGLSTTLDNTTASFNVDDSPKLNNSALSSALNQSSDVLTGATFEDNIPQTNVTETANTSAAALKANNSSDSTVAAEAIASPEKVQQNTTSGDESAQEVTPVNAAVEDPLSSNTTTVLPASGNSTEVTSAQPSVTETTLSASNTTSSVANATSPADVTSNTTEPTAESTAGKTDGLTTVVEEVRVNQILSSESYYAIRNYLDAVVPDAKEDVILIPSLITDDENIDEKAKAVAKNDGSVWHNGRQFHSYNRVDLLTTATVLHGVIVSSLSGLVKLQDDIALQNIIVSSLRMLTWFLNNPQEVVTMVTLSTFPSRYQLYWVTARVAFQLNSRQAQSSKMFQFADGVILPFVAALRDKMTFSILQSITDGGLGQDGKTRVYIDDFIGVADLDDKGHKLVSGDDRVFTSALAINVLIAAWTVQKETGVLEFVKDIGDPVRIAINSLSNYVSGAITDPANHNLNAYMSEQPKNCETLPPRYPANIITSSDGTELNPSQPELNHKYGVKGYISKVDYQNLLAKSTFGYTTRGGSLEDLNSPTSIFRFWSSVAYTKAVALLAIAQAANLEIDTAS